MIMAYTCLYKGVIFIEGGHEQAAPICAIEADLSFKFGAQLKNLNHVKDALVEQTLANGGNCVTHFTYGQKSRWLALDDVAYWGKGTCVKLPQYAYEELCAKYAT